MTAVAFTYRFCGMDLTVDAEFAKHAPMYPGEFPFDLSGIEVKNPDGEDITDEMSKLWIRPWAEADLVTVLSRIEIDAVEEIDLEEME